MARKKQERTAVYVISVAAELAGVHPQTLRIYERKGLLTPERTAGNTRRYSAEDIARLRRIQELTQSDGVNLAGARMILHLEEQLERMQREMEALMEHAAKLEATVRRHARRTTQEAANIVPARQARSLQELWIEHRRKEAGGGRPIQLGPPTNAG